VNHEEVLRYFDARLEAYGPTLEALAWGSPETQRLRFGVLAAVAPLDGCDVLDVGCGLGDFWDHARRAYPTVRCESCDINPRMVEAARARYPSGRFVVADLLGECSALAARYDYVLASGLFSLRDEGFLEAMVPAMYARCRRAVAFNSLSTWGPHREPGEYVADPLHVLAFCRTLTSRVTLRHDYLEHDFTVYLYRDA